MKNQKTVVLFCIICSVFLSTGFASQKENQILGHSLVLSCGECGDPSHDPSGGNDDL